MTLSKLGQVRGELSPDVHRTQLEVSECYIILIAHLLVYEAFILKFVILFL